MGKIEIFGAAAAVALGMVAAPAAAQEAACPAELAGFGGAGSQVGAASAPDIAGGAMLSLGAPNDVSLWTADQVSLAVPPSQPGTASQYAGTGAIEIATAGSYEFALGAKAWLEVVQKGVALQPSGHAMPACPGVAKTVSYSLQPGRYLVQLAQSPAQTVRVFVVAAP